MSTPAGPAILPEEFINRRQLVYLWMAGIFLTSLIVANLIGALLFSPTLPVTLPWGLTPLFSAGIVPFPVTFVLTDLLNEYYGQRGARTVTFLGFGMSVLVYGYLAVAETLPVVADSPFPQGQFLHFSKLYTGMFVASLMAYLIGQLLDIHLFQVFKALTRHRLLWVRATGSTVVSQLFDSAIVTTIAFWGMKSGEVIFQIALSNYVWKFLIALGVTPVLYLGHFLIRKLLRLDTLRGTDTGATMVSAE